MATVKPQEDRQNERVRARANCYLRELAETFSTKRDWHRFLTERRYKPYKKKIHPEDFV